MRWEFFYLVLQEGTKNSKASPTNSTPCNHLYGSRISSGKSVSSVVNAMPLSFFGCSVSKAQLSFWVRNTCTAVRAPEKKGTLPHLLLYKVQWLLCAHFNKAGSSSSSYGTMWNWKWDSEKVSQISNPCGSICQGLMGIGSHTDIAWSILSFQPDKNQAPSSPMP